MSRTSHPSAEKPCPWFPKVMKDDESVFLMDATHRGDMYHMRAAMQLHPNYSLCLYNCSTDTEDLVRYLQRSILKNKKHVFLAPCKSDVLYSKAKPTNTQLRGCTLDGKEIHSSDLEQYMKSVTSENKATSEISNSRLPEVVSAGMVILESSSETSLKSAFENLFEEVWDAKRPTILGMYRDTGTKAKDGKPGVYPELDTGSALGEIAKVLPEKGGNPVRIVSCGNPSTLPGITDNIGEYWNHFKTVKLDPKDSRRDAEAFFLKWAFMKGYYQMAAGFRSGPLDLFTFLGIPTVSIGLRNMVGEFRHKLLASEAFKRVNIQYDQPRHYTTAYFKTQRRASPQMTSPFWVQEAPQNAKRPIPVDDNAKKADQEKTPEDFAIFDKSVLQVGFSIACQKYIGTSKSVELLQLMTLDVITRRVARYSFPVGLAGESEETQRIAHFQAQRQSDESSVEAMGSQSNLTRYQLTNEIYLAEYDIPFKEDWTNIHARLGLEDTF